jgi:hypothetical protein
MAPAALGDWRKRAGEGAGGPALIPGFRGAKPFLVSLLTKIYPRPGEAAPRWLRAVHGRASKSSEPSSERGAAGVIGGGEINRRARMRSIRTPNRH